MLVGGDKSDDWRGWYVENIPIADERLDEHQAAIEKRTAREAAAKKKQPAKGGKRRSRR